MVLKIQISCLVVVALSLILEANALKCYRCNSFDNADCLGEPELNGGRKNSTKLGQFLRECEPDEKGLGREPFCRKITITILKPEHYRVIRDCAYERSDSACYKADNEDHMETVCQCFSDQCNGVSRLKVGMGLGIAVVAAFVRLVVY
ncbi:uncharacterized protein LOC134217190 [Armigeres subalbatus]|uniref:uncharacterized protein LOC134217190 n=1 Tax=Armigeres subalbatus TaxID=124917 RepID=UPI002ED67B66